MDITSYLLGKNSAGGGGGGSDLDWTAIGYSERPEVIDNGYNYAKQIYQNWIPATDLTSKFENDYSLIYMPLVDTSSTTNMNRMFYGCMSLETLPQLNTENVTSVVSMFANCYNLKEISQINTSKLTAINSMFQNCYTLTTVPFLNIPLVNGNYALNGVFSNCWNLSDESLNNILQMCISAISYGGTKTLVRLGINSVYYPAERIQALSNYQAFLDAGWTIGY